ncbi:sulfatase-like hydrolase/transferase [Candidatus Pelagisphaera phototrophica]|uniref:sulfatase-like hydrolase/transferase n=1 Tax=Candidatus Pelagisphaera phototrophica TaxID=2684113 RepID=UPI0019DDDE12|nr:sulfatase-like hydrolase/transferase [Candidatus Pelagisphaera phototrophica]QXD31187.1 sulfatase-like hydrolase/transferase [Candidatus Pelagisphaera phototrophica]
MKRSLTQPLVLFSLVLSGFLIADDRPNIIFFLTDDQRHDTLGCAGNPIVETPTIDKLAAQGAEFTKISGIRFY